MSAPASVGTRRLLGIDAARGAAMFFVCLAHFGHQYFAAPGSPDVSLLWTVSMVASPTFMLISGMMLGLLYETRRDSFATLSRGLIGRGVFLLTVGHALIVLSVIPRMGVEAALTRGFVTDVIGAAIIIGPLVLTRTTVTHRMLGALAAYAIGAAMGWWWMPTQSGLRVIDYALGGPNMGDLRNNFPLLPWIAMYFLGTALGERLGIAVRNGQPAQAERTLLLVGTCGIFVAVAIKGGYLALRGAGFVAPGETIAYAMTSLFEKFPPSIPYLAFYGGVGLLMTAAILFLARRQWMTGSLKALAVLGRASLFVFLLQFFVYYTALHYLALPYSGAWPVVFAVSLILIWACARTWLALDLNHVFDVTRWFGVRRLAARV